MDKGNAILCTNCLKNSWHRVFIPIQEYHDENKADVVDLGDHGPLQEAWVCDHCGGYDVSRPRQRYEEG